MRREALVLAAILTAALALRLARIDATDLWLDEACSVHYATLDWGELWQAFDDEIHPPLYYLALRAWGAVLGFGPVAVRSLSLVASLLTVVLVARLARRRWGAAGALVAAGVLAAAPLGIYYGVEARPYALATLVVTAAIDRWIAWLELRRRRDAIAFALLLAAAPYVHYFTLFVVPLVPLALWLGSRERRRSDLALAVLPLLAFAPWLVRFGLQHVAADSKAWIGAWWYRYGPLGSVARSAAALGGGAAYPPYLGVLAVATRGAPLEVPATLAFGGLLAGGLLAVGRATGWTALALAAWLVVPVALPVAVSLAGTPVFIPGRYEVFALPAAALLVGAVAAAARARDAARGRWAGGGAVLVVLLGWGAAVAWTDWTYLGTDVERPVRLLRGLQQKQGDGVAEVLAVGFAFAPMRAAEVAEPTGVPVRPVPPALAAHPGWENKARPVDAEDLPVPLGRPGDVWLVSQEGDGFERWRAAEDARLQAQGLRVSRAIAIGDLRLAVYSRSAGNPLPAR